jgi:predicted ATPase
MPHLQVLGDLRLESNSFTQPKPLALLSYLSLEGPKLRRHLAELFWPQGNRMKSLSMTLTRLRQGVGDVIEADEKQVKTNLTCDAKLLLESLDNSHWQQASNLYTGAFLEGVLLEDWSNELEEWVYSTREYLAERVQHALLNLAEDAARKQDFVQVREFAEQAYTLPGLSGSEISSLKRLYPLLCASSSLLAPDVRKELEGYGTKVQLSTEEARVQFKPLIPTTNLPAKQTSFIGRDEELAELATLLSQPNLALLTLLGPAGVGKTRLALQLAHEQQKLGMFKDGVYFVSLEALSDASLIPMSLITHFGLTKQDKTEPIPQLTDFIAHKQILLILDNFEHLNEGAHLLSTLLAKCPNLRLLVTSRERLNLEEEHIFILGGLPSPQALSENAVFSDAVQLFCERAQQVQPHFDVKPALADVLRICQLVDGLPLGLELAASWVRVMSCTEISAELEKGLEILTSSSKNIPERHRSLKAAFEQSWKLLTSKEQEVLRKLSVFVGGFRREAASDVAGATIPVLASLVDKSLLRVLPNGRYDQHLMLHQFTREKLLEDPQHLKIQAAQAHYYLTFAEQASLLLKGKEQVLWFGRLDEELDNFRETLNYLETKDDPAITLQLASTLGYFWDIRGYYVEGSKYIIHSLEKVNKNNLIHAQASLHAGELLWKQGMHIQAQAFYMQSLETAKHLDDPLLQAKALLGLGKIAEKNQGNFAGACAHYQSALHLAEQSGDKSCLADTLCCLASLSSEQGDYHNAQANYEKAAQLYEQLGDYHSRTKSLVSLATQLTYLGQLDEAHKLNLETLELFRLVGDRHGIGIALLNLGMDASQKDNQHESISLQQKSLQIFRTLGNKRMMSHLLNNLGGSFQILGNLGQAKQHLEESLEILKHIGDVSLIAHALYLLGKVSCDEGDYAKARGIFQECMELCRKHTVNWTLMRVLETSAKLHIQDQNLQQANFELYEARTLAQQAGDKKTLEKISKTQMKLQQALAM